MRFIVSIDPGEYKSGIILVNFDEDEVVYGKIVHSENLINLIRLWSQSYPIEKIFLGNGTTSSNIYEMLSQFWNVQLLEEYGTTLKARKRYWELWPPKNWLKIFPRELILPPNQLDAVAALVILEDYLKRKLNWKNKPSFKIELSQ